MAGTMAIACFSATAAAPIISIYCFYNIWNGYCVNAFICGRFKFFCIYKCIVHLHVMAAQREWIWFMVVFFPSPHTHTVLGKLLFATMFSFRINHEWDNCF